MFSVLKKSADTAGCDLIAVEIEGDLSPAYQNANLSLARAVMHSLGYEKQLRPFVWPARFQKLAENPDVILDGAHNLPGVRALLQSVPENCVFYASFLKEKQAQEMIALLHTKGEVKLVSFEDERLADLNAFSLPVLTMEQMQKEIESRTKPCVICGSLHFAGKVLACLA
jgi:dihydrofolate synthase/folylpolyglutamate synthase